MRNCSHTLILRAGTGWKPGENQENGSCDPSEDQDPGLSPGAPAHIWNPNAWEAEAWGKLQVGKTETLAPKSKQK